MKRFLHWAALVGVILAIILVPFFLAGARIEAWTVEFLKTAGERPWLSGVVLSGLLASDIVLPIPSSIVSTASGFVLGAGWGTLTSFAGMTVSCVVGYWLGRSAGRPAAARLVGQDQMPRLERLNSRVGDWLLVICRPVPVLAEASVFFLGIVRVGFGRFMLLASFSNLAVSATYAILGATSASLNSFLLAFLASILIPGAFMLMMRRKG